MISKIARVFLPVVIACGALAGCVTIDNETLVVGTAPLPTPTAEATATPEATATAEATATEEKIYGGKELVEQLVFENKIPDLSQKEMKQIVDSAFRFKADNGNVYSLGYFSMQRGYIGLEGILIDLEKSASRVNGNEFWRLLMITELKKAGGFEGADEKKYIVVPVYLDNNDDGTSKISFSTDIMGSESGIGIYDLVQALNEQKDKHGYFQAITYNQTYFNDAMVEEYKTMSNWLEMREYIMRVYNGNKEATVFEEYVIKHDYEGLADCVENEKPFLDTISITISGD